MFLQRFRLFRAFGIAILIDASWVFLALLITWSLATGVFPGMQPGLSPAAYWAMGAAGALGLFASIVLHELGHALAARRSGVATRSITLFIFGGVAELEGEPPSALAEFVIAIAGPAVSVAIALASWGLSIFARSLGLSPPAVAVLAYLGIINAILVAFNMIPAFPLDGGRVLRSALWAWKRNLRWATRITARLGVAFAWLLIAAALWSLLRGAFIAAVWWFMLGMFLRSAARMSEQQVVIRQLLHGQPVSRFMRTDVLAAPPHISLDALVNDYIYQSHYKFYPVVDDAGRLLGCVTTRHVKDVPRERWPSTTVADVLAPCSSDNTIGPEEDALSALTRLSRTGASRLLVATGARLHGIVALKDLMRFLAARLELEGDGPPVPAARPQPTR